LTLASFWWFVGFLAFLFSQGYTSDVSKEIIYAYPGVFLLLISTVEFEKGKKLLVLTAILTGIKAATTNYIAVMDTDFNHDPEVLTKMWKYRNTHQLVIGSRYVSAGGMQNRFRYWLSFLFNLFLRGILYNGYC